jgi:hypothetical protein
MKIKTLLWLDDYRDPKDSGFLAKFCPEFEAHRKDVIWVKNFYEFEQWIIYNGLPDKISFDHDLADEHYAPVNRYGDYNDWASENNFKEKTGMDAAKWLVDYCLDYKRALPEWSVHSANPSGAENITKLLLNFMKHQDKFLEE